MDSYLATKRGMRGEHVTALALYPDKPTIGEKIVRGARTYKWGRACGAWMQSELKRRLRMVKLPYIY